MFRWKNLFAITCNNMKVAKVQFVSWDRIYYFDPQDINIKKGYKVVVRVDNNNELGEVVDMVDVDEKELKEDSARGGLFGHVVENSPEDSPAEEDGEQKKKEEKDAGGPGENMSDYLRPILRRANIHDIEKLASMADKNKALAYVKQAKDKYNLQMKFVDVYYSFDSSRITFAFIADGRVDFRELVKDVTRHFSRTVRLQQIGIRDEAKLMGDYGHCGKKLCCRKHLKELVSITSDMAELQQCSHRGAERISGICGRLMCCLAYEEGFYEELSEKLPAIGRKVSVDGKKGVVVRHHTLKQSVDVEFSREKGENNSSIVEVDLNRHKN